MIPSPIRATKTGPFPNMRAKFRKKHLAQASACRIEIRLDACRPERTRNCKSIETSLDAADMNVRATSTQQLLNHCHI